MTYYLFMLELTVLWIAVLWLVYVIVSKSNFDTYLKVAAVIALLLTLPTEISLVCEGASDQSVTVSITRIGPNGGSK